MPQITNITQFAATLKSSDNDSVTIPAGATVTVEAKFLEYQTVDDRVFYMPSETVKITDTPVQTRDLFSKANEE